MKRGIVAVALLPAVSCASPEWTNPVFEGWYADPEGYVEGPFMLLRGGKYYFMWSEGRWRKDNYKVAYAIADSPLGSFVRENTILETDSEVGTGAGHHSVVKDPRTDDWLIVYHRHPLGDTDGNHRVVCIDRLEFSPDGKIQPVRMRR